MIPQIHPLGDAHILLQYTSAGAEYGNKGADVYHQTEEKARSVMACAIQMLLLIL